MKATIPYFSGTGNSIAISEMLALELKNSGYEVQLLPLAGICDNGKYEIPAGTVIFVFPVYAGGIPVLVADKLARISIAKTSYIAAIANCAGGVGAALDIFDRELGKSCHQRLSAGWVVRMPGNYTPLYGAKKPERIVKILNKAEIRVKRLAADIIEKRPRRFSLPSAISLLGFVFWKLFAMNSGRSGRRFRVDDSCTGCCVCESVCPVGNVKIGVRKHPEWGDKCQQCMACLQYCPEEAIQCFWWTKGRARYRNPNVGMDKIIAQKLSNQSR